MRTAGALVTMAAVGILACNEAPYSIKRDDSVTGSHIRRDAVIGKISFEKTYEQLNSEEKLMLRSAYETLPETDEPPYPRHGMNAIATRLIEVADASGVTGEVFGIAKVDASGNVRSVSFIKVPNADVAKAIAFILVNTPFKPALCGGEPCPMDFPLNARFARQ